MRHILVQARWLFFLLLTVPTWGTTPEDYYQQGLTLYQQGKYEDALTALKWATNWQKDRKWKNDALMKDTLLGEKKLHTTNWRALKLLGNTFFKLGDKEEALTAYEECLDVYPDDPEVSKMINYLKGVPDPTPTPTPMALEVSPVSDDKIPEGAEVTDVSSTLSKLGQEPSPTPSAGTSKK